MRRTDGHFLAIWPSSSSPDPSSSRSVATMTSKAFERSRSRQSPLFVTASTVYRSRSDRAIASLLAESWSTTSTRMRESYRRDPLGGSAAHHGFHILAAYTVLPHPHRRTRGACAGHPAGAALSVHGVHGSHSGHRSVYAISVQAAPDRSPTRSRAHGPSPPPDPLSWS